MVNSIPQQIVYLYYLKVVEYFNTMFNCSVDITLISLIYLKSLSSKLYIYISYIHIILVNNIYIYIYIYIIYTYVFFSYDFKSDQSTPKDSI